jgi:hypothetical protein
MWNGYADVLCKVAKSSKLGNWSYEVIDTKLAQETRAGTILQLCLYSEIVASIQGVNPEEMYVVSPGRNFERETFRVKEYEAYYRFVKSRLEREISTALGAGLRPAVHNAGGTPALHDEARDAGWKPAVYDPGEPPALQGSPEAVEHCEICGWWLRCNEQRRPASSFFNLFCMAKR